MSVIKNDMKKRSLNFYKEDERGIRSMCEIWDEVRQEGREEGIELGRKLGKEEGKSEGKVEGKAEEKIQFITNLWNEGYQDLEMIQKASGLPLTKIKQILEL